MINPSCPVPNNSFEKILLAHGGGGSLMNNLIERRFLPLLDNQWLRQQHDGAILDFEGLILAFTTDSFVVEPLFFPGGDIGRLAVCGTVNDLASCGARPLFLSLGLIIEEGFPITDLDSILISIRDTAALAGVHIVTGDTKVVEKGKGDKIFINTSGIGIIEKYQLSPGNCREGDIVIISGNIAEHGIAIMSRRSGLEFDGPLASDCTPLNSLAEVVMTASDKIRVMRDPTRGGVASALNEIAKSAGLSMLIEEKEIPVTEVICGACEILGFDPLYIANEGKMLVFVAPDDAAKVLEAMQSHTDGKDAAIIGKLTGGNPGRVVLRTQYGSSRILDMLSGEQLPRIC